MTVYLLRFTERMVEYDKWMLSNKISQLVEKFEQKNQA